MARHRIGGETAFQRLGRVDAQPVRVAERPEWAGARVYVSRSDRTRTGSGSNPIHRARTWESRIPVFNTTMG